MTTRYSRRAARSAFAAIGIGAAVAAASTATTTAIAAEPATEPATQPAAKAPTSTAVRQLQRQNAEMAKALAAVQQQLREMQQQLSDVRQATASASATAPQQQAVAAAVAASQQALQVQVTAATQAAAQAQQSSQQVAREVAVQAAKTSAWDKTSLWGYGEIYYTRPTKRGDDTTADLARAVFGIGYQFDDATRFNSEFEVEHAVASADDVGEFEVEQFYVDHKFTDKIGGHAGLFLIPAGFLNENHEPTNYYGVQRNFVETAIIPSTWREGGLALYGTTDAGLEWNVGLTTGLNLSGWDFQPEAPQYTTALGLEDSDVAPMQATHQELSLANARHLSQYLALNYRGVPGLTLGGLVFTGLAAPAQPNIVDNQRVTLWETHARWQPGKWDLSALYARGTIGGTGAANRLFPGTANPLPARFDGWFGQVAYTVWENGGMRLSPFGRLERYDMGARYEGIAPGFSPTPTAAVPSSTSPTSFVSFAVPRDTVGTLGANFYLNPNVVFKLDYQRFRNNTDFDRVDLGFGLAF